jgi:hypothetical protein
MHKFLITCTSVLGISLFGVLGSIGSGPYTGSFCPATTLNFDDLERDLTDWIDRVLLDAVEI